MATFAPNSAKRTAIAWPIPEVPPVTRTFFPFSPRNWVRVGSGAVAVMRSSSWARSITVEDCCLAATAAVTALLGVGEQPGQAADAGPRAHFEPVGSAANGRQGRLPRAWSPLGSGPTMRRVNQAADATVVALALCLPFETTGAALELGGVRFTSVETVLGLALAAGAVALAADPGRRARLRAAMPPTWALLLCGFAACALASALTAPAFGGTALKAAVRTWAGLALVPVALVAVRTRRHLAWIAAAIVAGAAVTAVIGVAEIVSDTTFAWLRHFRAGPTYLGTIRRLSATFPHPNIAAMFLEASLPLLAAVVWLAWRRRRTVLAAAGLALVVGLLEALVVTYSRGGNP